MAAEQIGRGKLDRIVPFVVWAFCLAGTVDAVIEGDRKFIVTAVPVLTAIAWGAWVVLARPGMRIDEAGITVVNVTKTFRIPYPALRDVSVAGLVKVIASDGAGYEHTIAVWNSSGLIRRGFGGPFRGRTQNDSSRTDRAKIDRAKIDRAKTDSAQNDSAQIDTIGNLRALIGQRRANTDPATEDSGHGMGQWWNLRELGILAVLVLASIAIRLS